jgi:long-chain fatty acid transport protein
MTTYKLGAEWQPWDDYTFRFGYSCGDQPIQSQDVVFNILAPGVMEQHFTVGLTRHHPIAGIWSISLMYAPENSVTGTNASDPTQTIELVISQFEFEVSFFL